MFNILGQVHTLDRVIKEGELLPMEERLKLQNQSTEINTEEHPASIKEEEKEVFIK